VARKTESTQTGRLTESGSRSDILKPLAIFIGLFLSSIVAGSLAHMATWLLALIAAALTVGVTLFLYSYHFCLINDRDALRSENYNIDKLKIEHGVYGDSATGILEDGGVGNQLLIETDQTPKGDAA
jgi:hypothetical protein